jgi:hypothetical protein
VKQPAFVNPPLTLDYLTGDINGPLTFKQVLFPIKENIFLARFENIGDRFDKYNGNPDDTYYVNVKLFADMLYKHMNGADAQLTATNIVETSLSGN